MLFGNDRTRQLLIILSSANDAVYMSDTTWWVNSDPAYCINGRADQAVGSNHPGGAQFLFCDGSVHFLRQNIEGQVLDCLAARNDGMSLGDY